MDRNTLNNTGANRHQSLRTVIAYWHQAGWTRKSDLYNFSNLTHQNHYQLPVLLGVVWVVFYISGTDPNTTPWIHQQNVFIVLPLLSIIISGGSLWLFHQRIKNHQRLSYRPYIGCFFLSSLPLIGYHALYRVTQHYQTIQQNNTISASRHQRIKPLEPQQHHAHEKTIHRVNLSVFLSHFAWVLCFFIPWMPYQANTLDDTLLTYSRLISALWIAYWLYQWLPKLNALPITKRLVYTGIPLWILLPYWPGWILGLWLYHRFVQQHNQQSLINTSGQDGQHSPAWIQAGYLPRIKAQDQLPVSLYHFIILKRYLLFYDLGLAIWVISASPWWPLVNHWIHSHIVVLVLTSLLLFMTVIAQTAPLAKTSASIAPLKPYKPYRQQNLITLAWVTSSLWFWYLFFSVPASFYTSEPFIKVLVIFGGLITIFMFLVTVIEKRLSGSILERTLLITHISLLLLITILARMGLENTLLILILGTCLGAVLAHCVLGWYYRTAYTDQYPRVNILKQRHLVYYPLLRASGYLPLAGLLIPLYLYYYYQQRPKLLPSRQPIHVAHINSQNHT